MTRLAAVVLLAIGLGIGACGALLTAHGLAYEIPGLPGFGWLAAAVGLWVLAVGTLHVITAVAIWGVRPWARKLGMGVGIVGAGVGAVVFQSAFDPTVLVGRGGDVAPPWPLGTTVAGLLVLAYLVVLVGLLIGGAPVGRRRASLVPLAVAIVGAIVGWVAYWFQLPLVLATCSGGPDICRLPPSLPHVPADLVTAGLWMAGGALLALASLAAMAGLVAAVSALRHASRLSEGRRP
jgi:hypothetical protein